MFGTFGGVVVIADHVVVMKGTSWTSKRFGADVSHLKASWDLLGDGESVDHIVVRSVGICVMVTDTWCSVDGVDDLDDWLIIFHNGDRADNWAAEDGLERSEDFYGTSRVEVDFELRDGRIFITLRQGGILPSNGSTSKGRDNATNSARVPGTLVFATVSMRCEVVGDLSAVRRPGRDLMLKSSSTF